ILPPIRVPYTTLFRSSASFQFLKVTMPLKEKYAPTAVPASNTGAPELNECNTSDDTRWPHARTSAATSSSAARAWTTTGFPSSRSEEHTSELQSPDQL